jgi:hypothetical protein
MGKEEIIYSENNTDIWITVRIEMRDLILRNNRNKVNTILNITWFWEKEFLCWTLFLIN